MGRALSNLFLVSLILFSNPGYSGTVDCKRLMNALATRYQDSKIYWKEVGASPFYSRLLVKPKTGPYGDEGEFWGFLKKTNPQAKDYYLNFIPDPQILSRAVTNKFLKDKYDFHLTEGVKYSGNKILNYFREDLTLSGLSLFILDTIALGAVVALYQTALSESVNAYIDLKISHQYAQWSDVLRYDYRYYSINQRLKEGSISPFDARKAVYLLNLAYINYFDYMAHDGKKDPFNKMEQRLRDHILFSKVADFAENGVYSNRAFYAFEPGPLTEAQKIELFNINHRLYFYQQAVSEWVWSGAKINFEGVSVPARIALKDLLNDPFDEKLVSLRDQGRLTNPQLLYFMGMNLEFERFFEQRNLLKIVPYRIRNGSLTDELNTDSLSDLQRNILYNIEHSVRMP